MQISYKITKIIRLTHRKFKRLNRVLNALMTVTHKDDPKLNGHFHTATVVYDVTVVRRHTLAYCTTQHLSYSARNAFVPRKSAPR